MCVVSMVSDHYIDKWGRRIPGWPNSEPNTPSIPFVPSVPYPPLGPGWPIPDGAGGDSGGTITITSMPDPKITQEEIDEFRRLLARAREYDARNNEPNCELDEKRQILLKIAEALGVEIDFI